MSPGPSYSDLSLSENGTFTLTYTYLFTAPEPFTGSLWAAVFALGMVYKLVHRFRVSRSIQRL